MSDLGTWSAETKATATPGGQRRRSGELRRLSTLVSAWTRAAVNPPIGPIVAIILVVFLGNVLYVFGLFNPNPINIVSGLGIITHAGLLPGLNTIDPNSGFTSQALGHLAALDLLHGHLPWWNPFEGLGAPLAGEMQSAALFPPTLLLAFANGQLFEHMLLEAVTGIATYRLLLRLNISQLISTACGCAFALNGTFSWFEHAPVNPIAFLPLALLGVERARAAVVARQTHGWGLISIAFALSLFAGFPEVAYLDALFALIWIVVRTVGLHRAEIFSYARKLAAGAGGALLLGAPILVAFADYAPSADVGAHASGFNSAFLPHVSAATTLFPYSFGPVFGFTSFVKTGLLDVTWGNVGGYLTTSLLVFALLGLYARRLRLLRIVLALWIVISLGRTYGIEPFARIFAFIPLMDKIAAYRYLPPSWEFAAVVLAGLGLDDIRRKVVPTWFVIAALLSGALLALAAFAAGAPLRKTLTAAPHDHAWVLASLTWGFGVLLALGICLFAFRGRLKMLLLLSCLILDVLVMFVVPDFSAPRQATIDTGSVVWLEQHLHGQRIYSLGTVSPVDAPLSPNYGSYFGIASININDAPIPKLYAQFIPRVLDANDNPFFFIGTYMSNPSGPTPLQEFLDHLANYEAIGVAFLVTEPGTLPSATAQHAGMPLVYSGPVADIYRLPRPQAMYRVLSGSCSLSDESVDSVIADCRGLAVVERQELYMDGWSASSGGRTLTVRRSDDLFQSVGLGSGRSAVSFNFLPPHEDAALAAFVIGLLLLAWGAWSRSRRSRRGRLVARSTRVPGRDED